MNNLQPSNATNRKTQAYLIGAAAGLLYGQRR